MRLSPRPCAGFGLSLSDLLLVCTRHETGAKESSSRLWYVIGRNDNNADFAQSTCPLGLDGGSFHFAAKAFAVFVVE